MEFDAGIKPDVLEHIIYHQFSAVESGESLGHGHAVNAGRSSKDQFDPY